MGRGEFSKINSLYIIWAWARSGPDGGEYRAKFSEDKFRTFQNLVLLFENLKKNYEIWHRRFIVHTIKLELLCRLPTTRMQGGCSKNCLRIHIGLRAPHFKFWLRNPNFSYHQSSKLYICFMSYCRIFLFKPRW